MTRSLSLLVLLVITVSIRAQNSSPSPISAEEVFSDGNSEEIVIPENYSGDFFGNPALLQDRPQSRLTGTRDFSNFIGFLGNPLQNIDPRAVTQLWPMFGSAWTSSTGPLPDTSFQLYGAGLNIALSERFSFGMNQGGFADVDISRRQFPRLSQLDPDGRFRDISRGGSRSGWLNLGGFFQYTFIQDVPRQFLLTGGLRWEAPAGSYEIFQGRGPVHLAPYITTGKEIGNYHVLATTGYQFPAGSGRDIVNLFYANLHLDRQCFGWLYPLVEMNWSYHTRSVDFDLPTRQGFFNFGNYESSGNMLAMGVGANAVLIRDRLEYGMLYSRSLATQRDFSFDGLIAKMVIRY